MRPAKLAAAIAGIALGSSLLFAYPAQAAATSGDEPTSAECASYLDQANILPDAATVAIANGVEQAGCDLTGETIVVHDTSLEIPEPGYGYIVSSSTMESAEESPTLVVATGTAGNLTVVIDTSDALPQVLGDQELGAETIELILEDPDSAHAQDAVSHLQDETPSSEGATRVSPKTSTSVKNKCKDARYSLLNGGKRYKGALKWRYNPAGAPVSGATAILNGAKTIVNGTNHCGVSTSALKATMTYEGTTTNSANSVYATGGCKIASDWNSRVGWGALPDNKLAIACTYFNGLTGYRYESDIKFNPAHKWSVTSTCSKKFDLQAVATHEWGHAFGLNHVDGGAGTQVMNPYFDYCSSDKRKLYKGDINGLKALYK